VQQHEVHNSYCDASQWSVTVQTAALLAIFSVAAADAVQQSSTAELSEQLHGCTAATGVLPMQLVNAGIIGSHV
jgi:hypothetical protein